MLHGGDGVQQDFSGGCLKILMKNEFSGWEEMLMPTSHSPGPPGLLSLSGSFTAARSSNSPPFSCQSCEEAYGHGFDNTSALFPKSRSMQHVACQAVFGKALSPLRHGTR